MGEPGFADAIALLRGDHRALENLFAAFESSRDLARRRRLAARICVETRIHALLEEEIFHPALRGHVAEDALDRASALLGQTLSLAETLGADPVNGEAMVANLAEITEREVEEQEHAPRGLFALCRETDIDLVALRDRLLARKEELTALAETGSLAHAENSRPHAA